VRLDQTAAPDTPTNPGIRLPGSINDHETLMRTLVGQQVSVVAARTTLGRMCAELCGDTGLFPTADQLAGSSGVVRGPMTRVRTILGAAEALASGRLNLDVGMPLADLEAQLLALSGVGPWTAGYVGALAQLRGAAPLAVDRSLTVHMVQ